jgi:hypothetical protein
MLATALQLAHLNKRKLRLIPNWYFMQSWDFVPTSFVRSYELSNLQDKMFLRRIISQPLHYFLYLFFKFSWKFGEKVSFSICKNIDLLNGVKIPKRTLLIYGYMQNPEVFNPIRLEILKLLRMSRSEEESLQQEILQYKHEGSRLIALHIRRGDRINGMSTLDVLSQKYYLKQLEKLNFSKNKVLVFSDDINWCRKNFINNGFHFVNELSPLRTIKLMSLCDDFIISISTFSWWGAWLSSSANKTVIMPKISDIAGYSNWNKLSQAGWEDAVAEFEE